MYRLISYNTILFFIMVSAFMLYSQEDPQLMSIEPNSNWAIDRISINDGLSQRSVGALVRDKQGYLWVGTEDGLNRYDGVEFKVFKNSLDDPNSISSSWINCIVIDSLDNLWIGTNNGLNYFDKKTEKYSRFYHSKTDSNSLSNSYITRLSLDKSGRLWVGTQNGLNLQNLDNFTFTRFNYDPLITEISNEFTIHGLLIDSKDRIWLGKRYSVSILDLEGNLIEEHESDGPSFSSFPKALGNVSAIIEDDNGMIWIGSRYLFQYNEPTHHFEKFDLDDQGNNYITSIFEDKEKNLWVGKKDLFRLERQKNQWKVEIFKEDLQNENSVSLGSFISDFTEDVTGRVWMGAWAGGLTRLDYKPKRFYNLQFKPYKNKKEQLSTVTGLLVDKHENIWIGTWGGGLSVWDRKNEIYLDVHSSKDYRNVINNAIITGVFEDSGGTIWICTHSSGLYKVDPDVKSVTNYDYDPNDPNSVSASYLSYVFEDYKGQIWVSSKLNGLCKMDVESETFETFKNDPNNPQSISSDQSRAIVEDKESRQLWIGTITGGLNMYDHERAIFTSYKQDQTDAHSLPSNLITELFVDRKNKLWIGTVAGLCQMSFDEPGHFIRYSMKDGLPNDVIYAIEEDEKGRLWISTNEGITCFNPDTEKFVNYNPDDGLLDKEYNGTVSSKNNSTGELLFGSIRSATIFQPSDFGTDSTHAPLIVTRATRHNSSETKGKAIEDLFIRPEDELVFNYQDKIITFQIATLDFTNTDQIRYQYHLEGFSEEWYELGQNREIVLTNLDPGSYTLFAKATNHDEIWSPPRVLASFVVHPPWYASWWAFIIYSMLLLAMGYGYYFFQKRRWYLQTQLQLEQAEAVRLKELDVHKNNLFANITHEFRTPLTMILGLTQQLRNSPGSGLQKKLGVVERNGKQLLSLVNQMLDLTKLETGVVEVNYVNGDVMAYIGYLVESYQSYAMSHQKSLAIFCHPKSFSMDYEPEILHRIIENLISNALKFTNQYGQIKVEVTTKGDVFQLEVSDNGIGMSEVDIPYIFDRFYQADSTLIREKEGTGIGLALVKELVDLLGGDISVSSTAEIGSAFVVILPITNDAPDKTLNKEAIKAHVKDTTILSLISNSDHIPSNQQEEIALSSRDDRPLLLIIEDNNDVINYLKSCLKDNYEYLIGRNGKKGVDLALRHIPDIIVTDLMMPVMDGFEVCEKIKQDLRTSHIPIIMLTAKATLEDRLTGLSKGADVYLSKPFNEDELHIRLENLIENRKALQRKLQNTDEDQNNPESTFLTQVKKAIYKNLDNESFDVTSLCREIGMSRAQLHRKIKALTDYSTGQFIRLIRMIEAKKLLESSEYNVSEVADMVGFRHHTNFTIAFKNEFGVAPSDV